MAPWRVMTFGNWQGYDVRMTAPPTPPRAAGSAACRWCGGRLSALARVRGDVCDAMDCRRRTADALTRARLADGLDALRAAAARAVPGVAGAPLLWLRHHDDDVGPPQPVDVAELRAHLLALEDDVGARRRSPADAAPAEGRSSALDAALCTLCRGRCCRLGLGGHAFLEARQLLDWLAGHPGAGWADAVEHYVGLVAPEHLRSSCLFHGRAGCTLPRERRSDVCNQFACDTLEQARDSAGAAADAVVVVGIAAAHELRGAAVVTADGIRRLDMPTRCAD